MVEISWHGNAVARGRIEAQLCRVESCCDRGLFAGELLAWRSVRLRSGGAAGHDLLLATAKLRSAWTLRLRSEFVTFLIFRPFCRRNYIVCSADFLAILKKSQTLRAGSRDARPHKTAGVRPFVADFGRLKPPRWWLPSFARLDSRGRLSLRNLFGGYAAIKHGI